MMLMFLFYLKGAEAYKVVDLIVIQSTLFFIYLSICSAEEQEERLLIRP